MFFKISWAADPRRSGTVWFRSGMVPSCHKLSKVWRVHVWQNYNEKMILTSNFSSVFFRYTRSRQTFDT